MDTNTPTTAAAPSPSKPGTVRVRVRGTHRIMADKVRRPGEVFDCPLKLRALLGSRVEEAK
jgi:hypothetical protein